MKKVSAERDDAFRERVEARLTSQRVVVKALSFGDDAFKNVLEQVVVLNLGVGAFVVLQLVCHYEIDANTRIIFIISRLYTRNNAFDCSIS